MEEKKKSGIGKLILIISVIAIIVTVILNLYTVQPDEFVIIREFGKIVKVVDREGLHIMIPFVNTRTSLPSNLLHYDVPPTEVNTLDKKRIMVDYYALWKINDPVKTVETLKTLQGAENRLSDIMYSAIRNELGKLEYGDIINAQQNGRGNFDAKVQEYMNGNLSANGNGIEIIDIQMKRIDLPDSNEESVYKRMISERASKAQEYLSQGEAEKMKITADVDRQVKVIIAKAKADAAEIRAEGEKEAQKIYNSSYGKDPQFFELLATLESYKTTIDDETVILMPYNSPYLKYLK